MSAKLQFPEYLGERAKSLVSGVYVFQQIRRVLNLSILSFLKEILHVDLLIPMRLKPIHISLA